MFKHTRQSAFTGLFLGFLVLFAYTLTPADQIGLRGPTEIGDQLAATLYGGNCPVPDWGACNWDSTTMTNNSYCGTKCSAKCSKSNTCGTMMTNFILRTRLPRTRRKIDGLVKCGTYDCCDDYPTSRQVCVVSGS